MLFYFASRNIHLKRNTGNQKTKAHQLVFKLIVIGLFKYTINNDLYRQIYKGLKSHHFQKIYSRKYSIDMDGCSFW